MSYRQKIFDTTKIYRDKFSGAEKELEKLRANRNQYADDFYAKLEADAANAFNRIRIDASRDIRAAYSEYESNIKNFGSLKGSDLNSDDVNLLNCGLPLNTADLRAVAVRNAGNTTMLSLVQRYANTNHIECPSEALFATKEMKLTAAENLMNAANTAVRDGNYYAAAFGKEENWQKISYPDILTE